VSSLAHNSLTRKAAPPQDTDAKKFIALAAGLRHGVPPDIRAEDCGAWRPHAEDLIRAAQVGGCDQVEVNLEVLARDGYTNVVEAIRKTPAPRKTHFRGSELLAVKFEPPAVIVPGLAYEGLNLCGGRPKMGKSWLGLQLAAAVESGGKLFNRDVPAARVLYLALEDNAARLQSRVNALHWQPSDRIDFHLEWSLLAEGGIDALAAAVEREKYKLIVIDTASAFMGGKIDQMDLGQTHDAFRALQRIGQDHHAAMWMIDHHRKSQDLEPDPINDLLGSTGKSAPADVVMGLYRSRGKAEATLMTVGRDLTEELTLALKWDRETCCWQYVGTADDVKRNSLQADIILALGELESATTSRLAQYLSKREPNISAELAELIKKGHVVKGERQGRTIPYMLTLAGKAALDGI
jgi:hypothetical protein